VRGLVRRALLVLAVFGALHAVGAREDVAILSGSHVPCIPLGVAYGLFYFAVVVGVPIALLAAGGLWVIQRFEARDARRAVRTPQGPLSRT